MADLKISQMPSGGSVQTTDEIPVNRGGDNYKVAVGSAAAADIGNDIGDIPVFVDVGGNPAYPAADGQNIGNILANNVTYNNSINNLPSNNVQGAIDFLYDKTDPLSRIDVPPTYRFQSKPEQDDPLLDFERSTVANRINARGFLQQASIDIIRHQYDALSGNYLGWLIELQKQNKFIRSNALDTGWTNAMSRITFSQDRPDPFGGNNGWRLTHSVAGTATLNQSVAVTNGTPVVQSYWVEPDNTGTIRFRFFTGTGFASTIICDYNPATKTFTAGSGLGGFGIAEELDTGHVRIFAWATPTGTGSNNIGVELQGGVGSYIGLSCLQLEDGTRPTSYIETAASTVTRAADQVDTTIPSINEGTLYFEGTDTGGTGGNGVLFSLSDGTSGNTVWVQRTTTERIVCVVGVGGVEYRLTTANNAVPIGSKIRGAISFRGGQVFASVNGTPVTLTVGTIPTTINTMSILRIGSFGNGANVNNGMIHKDGAIFERALSQDQINRITAI